MVNGVSVNRHTRYNVVPLIGMGFQLLVFTPPSASSRSKLAKQCSRHFIFSRMCSNRMENQCTENKAHHDNNV